jgi:hypothetical protein
VRTKSAVKSPITIKSDLVIALATRLVLSPYPAAVAPYHLRITSTLFPRLMRFSLVTDCTR